MDNTKTILPNLFCWSKHFLFRDKAAESADPLETFFWLKLCKCSFCCLVLFDLKNIECYFHTMHNMTNMSLDIMTFDFKIPQYNDDSINESNPLSSTLTSRELSQNLPKKANLWFNEISTSRLIHFFSSRKQWNRVI